MTQQPEMRLVPENLVRFLLGEGELDGLSFGDAKPVSGGRHGRFWWRTALRSCAAAPQPDHGVGKGWTLEERFPKLNDHLIRMASSGNVGSLTEWGEFFNCLLAALKASEKGNG